MTGLGAAIYGGFFGLAALWLFATADGGGRSDSQDQDPERSNSTNAADASLESRLCSLSQSASK